jgi:hypothetical protein
MLRAGSRQDRAGRSRTRSFRQLFLEVTVDPRGQRDRAGLAAAVVALLLLVVCRWRTAFASKMIQMAPTPRTPIEHCPSADMTGGNMAMTDADIRVPTEVRDRLARIASAEGVSLRAYLTRLSDSARLTSCSTRRR